MESVRQRLCTYCGEPFSINREQRRLYALSWLAGTPKPCPECWWTVPTCGEVEPPFDALPDHSYWEIYQDCRDYWEGIR